MEQSQLSVLTKVGAVFNSPALAEDVTSCYRLADVGGVQCALIPPKNPQFVIPVSEIVGIARQTKSQILTPEHAPLQLPNNGRRIT